MDSTAPAPHDPDKPAGPPILIGLAVAMILTLAGMPALALYLLSSLTQR